MPNRLNNSRLSMFEQKSPKSNNSPSVARSKKSFNNRRGEGEEYNASGQFSNLSKEVFGETNETFRQKMGANNNSWKEKTGYIEWYKDTKEKKTQKLDVVEGNKNIMCRYMLEGHSEEDDDLCLGNGSALKDPTKKKKADDLKEAFLDDNTTQEKLNNAFREYVKLYDFKKQKVQRRSENGSYINEKNETLEKTNQATILLKLMNIRTCGLERYLVYLGENRIGIYVPTKKEEANLKNKIHFPLYIHESMSTRGFVAARKKFEAAIDTVRGYIIKIGGEAEESDRSEVKGAKFGKGSETNRRLNQGVEGQRTKELLETELEEKGIDVTTKEKCETEFEILNEKKKSTETLDDEEEEIFNKLTELMTFYKKEKTRGGIMFGQLLAKVDGDDIKFNLIGKFDKKKMKLVAPEPGICRNNICNNNSDVMIEKFESYFGKELKETKEYDNDVFISSAISELPLRIFPNEIYGKSMGEPNYDIKIPAAKRKNIIKFCGESQLAMLQAEMDKMKNTSSEEGLQESNNIQYRLDLEKGLKKKGLFINDWGDKLK